MFQKRKKGPFAKEDSYFRSHFLLQTAHELQRLRCPKHKMYLTIRGADEGGFWILDSRYDIEYLFQSINGPIFLQTIPIPVQAQRVLSCISAFSSKIIRHYVYMIKTYIVKIQSRNLIHYHRLLAMIPKNKDPWQDHRIKNDHGSGSKSLNLNWDLFWLDDPVKDLGFFGS